MEGLLFGLFAIIACGGAISVVVGQNVVRMALGLIASLAAVSALFFLLSADFVGATQLMVYVGGTSESSSTHSFFIDQTQGRPNRAAPSTSV